MALTRRILSILLALILLLGGILAAVEILLALLGQDPWLIPRDEWASRLREQTWDAPTVRAVLVGMVVVGLVLLVVGLSRGRPAALTLPARADGPAQVTVTASRRGIERSLEQAVRESDGITGAKVSVSRHTAKVHATSRTRAPGDLSAGVESALAGRLSELGLTDTLGTKVRVTSREAR